jgi:ring-1,2-phenylacetyl-CoA epoxidase subunit PaaC
MTSIDKALFEYCLRLGDSSLILGHRLSEWCGHGPILEEDIALINIALDEIGRATSLLQHAAQIEGKGRTEDDLAYQRSERDFKNFLLTEQPNGDFAKTIVRQFFYDVYCHYLFNGLKNSKDAQLAGIAEKAVKEIAYHLLHSTDWMLRLGDGTDESHARMQNAINELYRFTGEMFMKDDTDDLLLKEGIAPDLSEIKSKWETHVAEVISEATLQIPEGVYMHSGSRKGIHTEHLGFLLAEMQYLPRMFPSAKW